MFSYKFNYQITATDPDTTQSSKITYEIGHDPYALLKFELNRRNGELILKEKLDYETRKNYTFTVSAISGELINQVKTTVNCLYKQYTSEL